MSGTYTVFGYNPFFVGFLWVLLEYVLISVVGLRIGSPVPDRYAEEEFREPDVDWRSDLFLRFLTHVPLIGSFTALVVLAPAALEGTVTESALFGILAVFYLLLIRNRVKTGNLLPPLLRFEHIRRLPDQRVDIALPGIQIMTLASLPAILITFYLILGPATVIFTIFSVFAVPFIIAVAYDYYIARTQSYDLVKTNYE